MPPERRMTEAELRRKTNKPIMEKKRRERINKCLEDLKAIVLTSVSEDSRPNKLEKADILEMTVRYLKSVKSGKPVTPAILTVLDTSEADDTKSSENASSPPQAQVQQKGYTQCVHEVTSFLSKSEGVPVDFRTKLLGHLADKLNPVKETRPLKKRHHCSLPASPARQHQSNAISHGFITELDIRKQSQRFRSVEPTSNRSINFPLPDIQVTPTRLHGQISLRAPQSDSGMRFSPIPVSPISTTSLLSPIAARQSPSPSLSASSHRSDDSTGETVHSTMSLLSPSHHESHRSRFVDAHHFNYISSDSGNWSSSGSNPPSPIAPAMNAKVNKHVSKSTLVYNDFKPTIKTEPRSSQSGMWRPWGS